MSFYQNNEVNDTIKLELLRKMSFNESCDLDKSIHYADELIELAQTMNDFVYLHRGFLQKGHVLRLKGDVEEAIDSYFKSSIAAQKVNYNGGVGGAYICIGDAYSVIANHKNSVLYYNKAIAVLKETNDSITLATALLNAGNEYFNVNILDTALLYSKDALVIFEALQYQAGIAYGTGNMGLVYAKQGKHAMAEEYINKATKLLEEAGDSYPIAVYDTYMADIYMEKGDWQRAIKYAHHSLQIAQEDGLKAQIRDASKKLAELYESVPNYTKAFYHQKQYLAYRDSLNNEEVIQNMADLRTEYEVSQKQAEVDLLDEQRRNQQIVLWALAFILMLVGGLVFILIRNAKQKTRTNQLLSEKNTEIESQRDKLQTTNEKLIELDQFKQGMTSMIVHDLKNPLNGIITRAVDDKVKYSGKQMLNMVLNILDVDKYENTIMTLDKTACGLLEISQHALDEVLFLAKQKNIRIHNHISPETGVHADIEITERIFTNILTNAIKYTPINGMVQVNSQEVLRPENASQKEFLKISISDTGEGIPAEKQHLIFQKFGQVMAKKSGGVRSTGVGLAFCKLAVEAHGGQIGVESNEGEGSVFWFTLPKGKDVDKAQQLTTIADEKPTNGGVVFSDEEVFFLLPFIERLKQWEVFDVSELEAITAEINREDSVAISQWKEQLEEAIYLCNQELLEKQLDIP